MPNHLEYRYVSQRVVALLVVFSIALFSGRTQAQSYAGLSSILENDSLSPPELFQLEGVLYRLPQDRDSLDWLVPQLIEKSEQYGEYLPRIYMLQQITGWYDNMYKDGPTAMTYANRVIALCELAEDSVDHYWLTNALSYKMFLLQQSGNEGEAVLIANQVADRLTEEHAPQARAYGYRQLCLLYERLRDFEKAKHFCRLGIRTNQHNKTIFFNNSFYETLALVHSKQISHNDSVIFYRKKGLRSAFEEGNERFLRTGFSNLADNYSRVGRKDSAVKYFALSTQYFEEYPYLRGELTMLLRQAQHFNRNGESKKALLIADTIAPLLDTSDAELWIEMWRVKAISMAYLNQGDSADHYLQLSDSVVLHRYSEERVAAEEEMAAKYETAKKEAAIATLALENRTANFQKWTFFFVALILLISGLFLYWKKQKDKRLHDLEQQRLQEEKGHAEEKANKLKHELERSISHALDHQNRNRELQELVEELNAQVENALVQSKAKVIRAKMSDYSLEETLDDIEYRAREVFPRLYSMLYNRLSGRSNVELVYCVMLVMNYSNEDISRILQKSEKAVKSLRYRIRKKLELEDGKSLSQYLKKHTERGADGN